MVEQTREVRDKEGPVVNTWQFLREGHKGQNYSGMQPEEFPDGMTLNVPRGGINPHEAAIGMATEGNVQNAWRLNIQRAITAQLEADASKQTAIAVKTQIGAATEWQNVATAKIGLQMAAVDTQIAGSQLNIRTIELEVVRYQEDIQIMSAPVRKANALVGALNVQEQFYLGAAELIRAQTDRHTQLGVLGIQGYDIQPIPIPEIGTLQLPSFDFPKLDEVMSSVSQRVDVVEREA